MPLKTADRAKVPPFIVMDVMSAAAAREAAGETVLHLEVGQPGTGLPKAAAARLAALIETERLGYTVALGMPALRERIARHYRETQGVDIPAERILVTTGSSTAFQLAFLGAFEAGDRVGLAAPGLPGLSPYPQGAGGGAGHSARGAGVALSALRRSAGGQR